MYLRYGLLLALNLTMFFLALFLAPILPLFALGNTHLPKWLSWFDTPDNPLDGDLGFILDHAPFKLEQTGLKRYINRVFWLWRNPSYGFDYSVLGATVLATPVVKDGDIRVSDRPTMYHTTGWSGYVKIVSEDYFEFYAVRQYGKSDTCFRVRLGWKLKGFIEAPESFKLGSKAQFVFSVKPAASFTNK